MHEVPESPPLPAEFLQAIGSVTVEWGWWEWVLDVCLVKLADLPDKDPRGMAIFVHMTFPQKLNAFGAFCDGLVDEHPRLANYKEVIKIVEEAQRVRNEIAHGKFFAIDGAVSIASFTARRKIKMSSDPIDIETIRGYTNTIRNAAWTILDLVIVSDETRREMVANGMPR